MTMYRAAGLRQISPGDAMARVHRGDAVLLDVREEHEFAAGHAPDAVWLPLNRVRGGAVPSQAGRRAVLCVCKMGGRSEQAAELLAGRGIDVLTVAGGMDAWAQAGLPVRNARGQRGQVV